ncbi:MAG: lysine--tRNA ligase [Patescibacteria group bacterium]
MSFWPEYHANQILKERGNKLVFATGITPSGPIHIGNLREILTADFVVKALADKAKITFYYIADDFDPLRKVYPFLDKSYEAHIGKPYFLIPCPCGKHASYADHFMAPFLTAIKELGVVAKLLLVSELYHSGRYTDAIIKVIEGREKIKAILEETSQRKIEEGWFPFNPLCRGCQKLRGKVTDFDLTNHTVSFKCPDCGDRGVADFSKGEGKLPWRIDWPARWWMLGVNVEPSGKDHASPGGSYETGERIAKEIFDSPAPYPIVYERVHLRGEGAMHSSTGLAIEASEILKAVSPTVIRYFFARSQSERHINFDPGEGVIQLYDEYRTLKPSDPAYKIATVEPLPDVPYRHLVMIYQASAKNTDTVLEALKRTDHGVKDTKTLEPLLKRIDVWLEQYAPERYKFTVQKVLPSGAKTLSAEQKHFLNQLLTLVESKKAWTGEDLHAKIHDLRKGQDIPPKEAFAAIYQIFLGQDSGPQVGWFLAAMDRAFVIERLQQATK